MTKNNKMRSTLVTAALLVASIALLIVSGTQTARASLSYFSDIYKAQINLYDIGVTLTENGKDISWRDYTMRDDRWNEHTGALLTEMLAETDGKLQLGRAYKEELAVRNSNKGGSENNIDEYVRVAVRCYWLDREGRELVLNPDGSLSDAAGNKLTGLSPALIHLNLLTGENGWVEDVSARTPERRILYYTKILKKGETTPAFSDTLTLDTKLTAKVTQTTTTDENGVTTITTEYAYDDYLFMIEANADAVQTHNAADAAKSAWGVEVTIADDGTLSLKQ